MSLHVLIVDGGRLAAAETAALLRFMGHNVLTAASVTEALQAAAALKPELVLIDWSMPAANSVGAEAVFDDVPIIAMGDAEEARRFSSVRLPGFVCFQRIPCARGELANLLDWAEQRMILRRDQAKYLASVSEKPKERRSRRWVKAYLPDEAVVFRLFGGMRDGEELTGDRAAHLYVELDWEPLNKSFLACRTRHIDRGGTTERHRYFVEAVMKSEDSILVIARHNGGVE